MIAKITEEIFLSGADEVLSMRALELLGITAILNVAHNVNDPQIDALLMVKVGIHEFEENKKGAISLATSVLNSLVLSGHKVLVHCKAGAHRSPFIIAKYLMLQGLTMEEAYEHIQPKTPWTVFNPPSIK